MHTGRRLLTGSVFRLLHFGLTVILALLITPVILHTLGDRKYGFWILVGTLASSFSHLDLGITTAVTRFVSRFLGQRKEEQIARTVTTAAGLFSAIGLISLVGIAAITVAGSRFIADPAEAALFRSVLLILGVNLAIGFPVRAFGGILTAFLRYDYSSSAAVVQLLLSNLGIYWLITNGYGLLAMAWTVLLTNLVQHGLVLFFAFRTFPALRLRRTDFSADMARTIYSYSWKSCLIQLGNLLRFKVDHLIVAGFLSVSQLTYYSIATRLITYFVEALGSVLGNLSPVFSRFEGSNDFEKIRRSFLFLSRLTAIVSIFGGASLMFYGRPFIERWLGPSFGDSYLVLAILAVPFTVSLIQTPTQAVLYGISRHAVLVVIYNGGAVLNLILSLVLVQFYGIFGVAVATAIELTLIKLLAQPIVTCRAMEFSVSRYYGQMGWLALQTVAPLLVFFYLIAGFVRPEYFRLTLLGIIQTAWFVPFAYFVLLTSEERQWLRKALLLKAGKAPADVEAPASISR